MHQTHRAKNELNNSHQKMALHCQRLVYLVNINFDLLNSIWIISGGSAEVNRWSNSAHNESRQYQQQQNAMKSTWSQASQQQQRQYQQQFQQQRQQQTKMAWQDQQSSTFSASRRKTWAESSVLHGGGISFAGHDHSCPASGLHSSSASVQQVPYKFERQTSSGHRVFLPTISN